MKDAAPSSLVMWTIIAIGVCVLTSFALFNAIYYNAVTGRLADWIHLILALYCVVVAVGLTLVVVSWRRGGRIVRILAVLSGVVLMAIPVQLLGNAVKGMWRWLLLG